MTFRAICTLLLVTLGASVPFRAPAVPLAVSTPFASTWAFDATQLAGNPALFWHGEVNTMELYALIDGALFSILGGGSTPSASLATQRGLPDVLSTTSIFTFTAGGVDMNVSFTTPHLPEQFDIAARPCSYVTLSATSGDGAAHHVAVLFNSGAEVVSGAFPNETITWDRPAVAAGVLAMRMGQSGQDSGFNYSARLMRSTEPHQSQDYGFVYVMADNASAAVSSMIAPLQGVVSAFVAGEGVLPGAGGDAAPPAAVPAASEEDTIVAALAWDLGTVSAGAPVAVTAVYCVDEVVSVLVDGAPLAPYWRRAYPVGDGSVIPTAPLADAVLNASSILQSAAAWDAMLQTQLVATGGPQYAAVAQLVYRQVYGSNGYAWNGTTVWGFQKEISSDGDMSTLDVIFPSSPLPLLHANGFLLRVLMEPELYLMSQPSFTQWCALHSLGKWPTAEGGNSCGMPMESTGDALLMATGITLAQGGDATWLQPYMPLLRRFADYCAQSLPFPAPQDMTDDFSHAPGNLTNLALKCILGIGAEGMLEMASNNASGAAARWAIASAFGAGFTANAWIPTGVVPGQTGHFKFIYNSTWNDSYGLMYNAVWARFLGLEGLIPNFTQNFNAHFDFLGNVTVNATWCTPLSSMEHDSKWDWLHYTAALQLSNDSTPVPSAWSRKVFDQMYFFANTTSSRFPLTDHPECTGTFPPAAAADRARPVMGALFAPLLVAQPPPAYAAARSALAPPAAA